MGKSYKDLEHIFGDQWFASFEPASRSALLRESRHIAVVARDFVFRKGDAPNGFYGVIEGVLAGTSLLENGRQMIFGLLESGDWFGEASSIDGLPRSNDILVLRDAQLLHVNAPLFERLIRGDVLFARAMAILQATRTRNMYGIFEDAALQTTRVRVARRLLKMVRGDAPTMRRSRRVVSVTHEMLAMMLGLTRQTLSLELKALAAAGAISLSYGRICIESESKLHAVSQMSAPASAPVCSDSSVGTHASPAKLDFGLLGLKQSSLRRPVAPQPPESRAGIEPNSQRYHRSEPRGN